MIDVDIVWRVFGVIYCGFLVLIPLFVIRGKPSRTLSWKLCMNNVAILLLQTCSVGILLLLLQLLSGLIGPTGISTTSIHVTMMSLLPIWYIGSLRINKYDQICYKYTDDEKTLIEEDNRQFKKEISGIFKRLRWIKN